MIKVTNKRDIISALLSKIVKLSNNFDRYELMLFAPIAADKKPENVIQS